MTDQELVAVPRKPFVSVVICTRDRASSLARTLESIVLAAAHASEPWELLIVDNGSSDDTAATVETFVDRLPIRRVWQPIAGLSNARNAGVAEASGEYMLWTDDDVIVDEQWLAAWFSAFRHHPEEAVFGGRAVPHYEEPHEPWFKANEQVLAALLAMRDEPTWERLASDRLPWGLNYALRAAEQRLHPYDPELGVAPGRRRGGEEEAVIRQILDSGQSGRWVWNATVNHVIPMSRQTERYIKEYYVAAGYDHPLMGVRGDGAHRAAGLWYAIKQIAKSAVLYRYLRSKDPIAAVRWLVRNAIARGSVRRYAGLPLK